jgi:hypothetical protein
MLIYLFNSGHQYCNRHSDQDVNNTKVVGEEGQKTATDTTPYHKNYKISGKKEGKY